ncbi:hypothetical protein [Rhizobium oryzihabitans]|uniref:hypothetical protein n=1 Tax=Rhizobium oryzihabitans TaxID=2267833 RepID=UPI001FEAE71C|nr:hypothetical protein [Rhizobium oryzihabitans]
MSTLEEIKKALEGVTPGPWKWFGNASSNHVYLATTHSGRRYVMDFVRWGMKGAQPRFQPERGGMVDAKDLLQFEVGDRDIVGMDAAKKDGSVYRYDVRGIDCPDARYIAAVNPAAISELLSTLESLQRDLNACQEQAVKDGNEIGRLRDWQAGAISCREAEQARVDEYKTRAEAAEAEVKRLEDVIEPFRAVSKDWVDENGWTDVACQNDRIVEWFGPSDFRALASTGGEHHAE